MSVTRVQSSSSSGGSAACEDAGDDVDVCVAPHAGNGDGNATAATAATSVLLSSTTSALHGALHNYVQHLAEQQYQVNRAYDALRHSLAHGVDAVVAVSKLHSDSGGGDDKARSEAKAELNAALLHVVAGAHTLFRFLYERVFVHQLENDMRLLCDVTAATPPLLQLLAPVVSCSNNNSNSSDGSDSGKTMHVRKPHCRDDSGWARVVAAVDAARRAPLLVQRTQAQHLATLSPLLLGSSSSSSSKTMMSGAVRTTRAATASHTTNATSSTGGSADADDVQHTATVPRAATMTRGGETVVTHVVCSLFAVSARYSAAEQHALVHLIARVMRFGAVVLPDMTASQCNNNNNDSSTDDTAASSSSSSSSSSSVAAADAEAGLAALLSCRCLVTPHARLRPHAHVLSVSKEALERFMRQKGLLPTTTCAAEATAATTTVTTSSPSTVTPHEGQRRRDDSSTATTAAESAAMCANEDEELARLLECLDKTLLTDAMPTRTTTAAVTTTKTKLTTAHVNKRSHAQHKPPTHAIAMSAATASSNNSNNSNNNTYVSNKDASSALHDTWTSLQTVTAQQQQQSSKDDDDEDADADEENDDERSVATSLRRRGKRHRHDDDDDDVLRSVLESQHIEYKHSTSCVHAHVSATATTEGDSDDKEDDDGDGGDNDDVHVTRVDDTNTTAADAADADADAATAMTTLWVFQISHSLRAIRDALIAAITQLGGRVEHSVHYSPQTTHLVLMEGVTERTEKYLSCCAAGAWVVPPRYVFDSARRGRWLLGSVLASYDANPCRRFALSLPAYSVTATRNNNKKNNNSGSSVAATHKMFSSWRVLLFTSSVFIAKGITAILRAGGCRVVHAFHCGPAAATTTTTTTADGGGKSSSSSHRSDGDDAEDSAVTLTADLTPHTEVAAALCAQSTHLLVECTTMMSTPALSAYFALPSWYPHALRQSALYTRTYTLELLYYCLCTSARRVFDDVSGALISEDALVPACRVAPFALQRE